MKQLFLSVFILLLFSGTAHAYESVNAGYVVLKTGLSGLMVEPQTEDGWKTFYIDIKSEERLGALNTFNANVMVSSDYEYKLHPKTEYLPKEKNYKLWQVNGRYNDEFFFIGGITIEGDVLHNMIVPHCFGLFILFLVLTMAFMLWHVNRGR